jgi:gamma-glutamyltranspeptidase/glutathione hydrolase
VDLAETGFPVDRHTHEAMVWLAKKMQNEEYQTAFNELYRTFLRDGKPYEIGDTLRRPHLAGTLRKIAVEGAGILYSAPGSLYGNLIREMKSNNGPIVPPDLTTYEIAIREPLAERFYDYETWTMPPPSSGGAVITEVLNAVERFSQLNPDLGQQTGSWPHFLVEVMKHAFADRALGLGDWDIDPDSAVHRAISRMTDSATATLIIDNFRPERTYPPEHYGTAALADDHGTSHYCVIDAEGRAVACTETINYVFGSYVMLPGTGIILSPLSSMSPTIVTRDGRPVLVVGGSGGPRIITGVLHVLLNVLEFGMRPDSAVAAPRFHHQWLPDRVLVEENLDSLVIEELIRRGHNVEEYPSHPGHIQLIARWQDKWFGASDPRKGGRPAGR